MDVTRPLTRTLDGPAGAAHPPKRSDPVAPKKAIESTPPAQPAAARVETRDQLYSVVRESMVRSGVLSSSYKFKVLAVDTSRRHFIVMVDLARAHGGEPARLAEMEVLIAQTARARFGILVSAVYWRLSEHVAIGRPDARSASAAPGASAATPRGPARTAPSQAADTPVASDFAPDATQPWLRPPQAQTHTQTPPTVPAAAPQSHVRFEPIQADEVDAFRRALASEVAAKAAAPSSTSPAERPATRNSERTKRPALWSKAPRLTGYEDTEAFQMDAPNPGLSATQYGDL